jgi:two-component system, NtrC family, nitrogen regulation response regulator NtrX
MRDDILIVDDEADIRTLIRGILEDEGYSVREAAHSRDVKTQLESHVPDLIILDIWLKNSEHDGLQILEHIKQEHKHLPVIMISGHGTIETAVSAIHRGAYDFIEKPFKTDRLLLMLERALESSKLKRENEMLRTQSLAQAELIGESTPIQNLRTMMERVAATNSRILITGEAGTGKEVVARAIHAASPRRDKMFQVINCASLFPERLEQDLFGSEDKGIIHYGVLERADGGTVLLDEVSDMPLDTQAKILRVLQDQSFTRVNGERVVNVDVRILASTNRDLSTRISQGSFREDLFYRLNVIPITLSPLRDHRDDIPILCDYFMSFFERRDGLAKRHFSASAMAALLAYTWPGNVRQLKNLIEWLIIMGQGNSDTSIQVDDLPTEISKIIPETLKNNLGEDLMSLPLREAREVFERQYLLSQVNRFNGNISKTAQFVEMERSALHRKLKSLNISTSERDDEAA